ncbi:hypothetical protein ACHAXR_009936 [Thalassiosira sp. AJA248-18]
MDGINLVLEEGKMYLVLGAPGCGKSTLLKMIANILQKDSKHSVGGSVHVNGIDSRDGDIIWSNLVSYVDQIDRLHGLLTVEETLDFAFNCCYGGSHRGGGAFIPPRGSDDDVDKAIKELDEEGWLVDIIMRMVGLTSVKDTLVGNNRVRGVSGGEKKRVTVAEMMASRFHIGCWDEISTGLDAATTFDICKLWGEVGRFRKTTNIIALLQPPPETVALFDEIILLDKGRIIYAGPVDEVTRHFKSLGYKQPERMDPADWLQSLPTKDGARFLTGPEETAHLTNEEFVQKYVESLHGQEMLRKLRTPVNEELKQLLDHALLKKKYSNSTLRSIRIIFEREILLWYRDKFARMARLMQNLIMGLVVGTVFWQNDDPQTVMGVVFQSVFFISMGSMLKVAPQIDTRGIFYKEQDANFYPTWAFVISRALAGLPTSLLDSLIYGSFIYWFSGFAPSAANYFVFIMLTLLSAFTCGIMFSVYSAIIKAKPSAQAAMSISLVVMVLFSGFTVQPDVIPDYYIWIYWMNIFAWIIRAVVINEYQSGFYDEVVSDDGTTQGEAILKRFGFAINGEAYGYEWVWYTVLFCILLCILSTFVSFWCLERTRFPTGGSSREDTGKEYSLGESSTDDSDTVSLDSNVEPKGATITFKDVNYIVKASTTKDKLHLLNGISGYFAAGKMTALMGSSGAGKTTLMDVLSLRKASGEVTGHIRINGRPQDPNSFRRMTVTVEQFDVQSPHLTIRETVEFSAKMRLGDSIPVGEKLKFVDHVLQILELDIIADFLVGDDTGGLSVEQKKRLSIAVELSSNPSCIFCDEPTSGLDARAASIVMRSLRRIADSGIAVVATIHQPSVTIFNSFDSLLLLKSGGKTAFFGDLGEESYNLIEYLESYPATTQIKGGENPATWMLTAIGAGSAESDADMFDYAKAYSHSPLASDCTRKIDSMNEKLMDENKIIFPTKYATSTCTQSIEVFKRLSKIYWRSPGYNRVRLLVSGIVALLFGSVFASQKVPKNESDMSSRVTSVYITVLFLGVNALNTVLPVFEMERNMFYRHKASLMYDYRAITLAFTLVEAPFILLSSLVFCLLWYFTVGFAMSAAKFFLYWLFIAFAMATFTFIGQAFMAVFRDAQTAQGFGSLMIGMNTIFGGVLIRPQDINGFWQWAYWTFPLHWILEGLLTSQFQDDNRPIVASFGSPFYDYLISENCPELKPDQSVPTECITGTAEEWIFVSPHFDLIVIVDVCGRNK